MLSFYCNSTQYDLLKKEGFFSAIFKDVENEPRFEVEGSLCQKLEMRKNVEKTDPHLQAFIKFSSREMPNMMGGRLFADIFNPTAEISPQRLRLSAPVIAALRADQTLPKLLGPMITKQNVDGENWKAGMMVSLDGTSEGEFVFDFTLDSSKAKELEAALWAWMKQMEGSGAPLLKKWIDFDRAALNLILEEARDAQAMEKTKTPIPLPPHIDWSPLAIEAVALSEEENQKVDDILNRFAEKARGVPKGDFKRLYEVLWGADAEAHRNVVVATTGVERVDFLETTLARKKIAEGKLDCEAAILYFLVAKGLWQLPDVEIHIFSDGVDGEGKPGVGHMSLWLGNRYFDFDQYLERNVSGDVVYRHAGVSYKKKTVLKTEADLEAFLHYTTGLALLENPSKKSEAVTHLNLALQGPYAIERIRKKLASLPSPL